MTMAENKHIRIEIVDSVSVLHITADDLFDRLVINEFQDEMLTFAKNECLPNLLISFGRVKTMSSEVLNALLRVRDWIVGNNGRLILCDMRDTIRQVFSVTNLDKLFEIHATMPEALDAF